MELAEFAMPGTEDSPDIPAKLTAAGQALLKDSSQRDRFNLQPGVHYRIKESEETSETCRIGSASSEAWVALPKNSQTEEVRHVWVFNRRRRPTDPTFIHCPLPRKGKQHEERNASLVMMYFHPFTLNPEYHSHHVPVLQNFQGEASTWRAALHTWFDGHILCATVKRYVNNFLTVTRARPENEEECPSEDQFSDEELLIDTETFETAIKTRVSSGRQSTPEEEVDNGQKFDLCKNYWKMTDTPHTELLQEHGASLEEAALERALQAARASQKQESVVDNWQPGAGLAGKVTSGRAFTTVDIRNWLLEVESRRTQNGETMYKEAQLAFLRKVCNRMCDELTSAATGVEVGDPLLWCLHGGPGVGKSESLKLLKELFEDVCGWHMGLDYQMAALQAVMAHQLGGDTLHHACGINIKGQVAGDDAQVTQRQNDVAQRVMQWRWLIIDEISMVSAKLLADLDMKLRDIVRKVGSLKLDKNSMSRAFGGINVILCGDFWQLDPPSGGSLATIPVDFIKRARQYTPVAEIAHGQAIFWGSGAGCVQGVTELTECIRTEDPWLLEIQGEMRSGCLSDDNWRFLHGYSTNVAGSSLQGSCLCGNPKCQRLEGQQQVMMNECNVCKEPRKQRHRVLDEASPQRYTELVAEINTPKFLRAPAVFPNNDIKCEVNKQRARLHAAATKQAITWVQARDTPCNLVIAQKPHLREEKVVWLQRHDRDCGDLYSLLPLVKGMPMTLTQHLDRNPSKNLLKGRLCYVDSWVLDDLEISTFHSDKRILSRLPKVVLVQFTEEKIVNDVKVEMPCEWTVPGIDRPGVYPIVPVTRNWFLDQNRPIPKLKVSRKQLPLAPAYAMTAHGSQGQALPAAIIDLKIGKGPSPSAWTAIEVRY